MPDTVTEKDKLSKRLKTLSKPAQIAILLAAKEAKQDRLIEAFMKNPPFRNKAELMAMSKEQLEKARQFIFDNNQRLSVKRQLWEQYEIVLEHLEQD